MELTKNEYAIAYAVFNTNDIELYIDKPEHYNWYVNVYEVYRAYGGPEEGGWYYDEGTLLDCQMFDYWGPDDLKDNKQRQRAIDYACRS